MVDIVLTRIYNITNMMNNVDKMQYKNIMNTVDKINIQGDTNELI